MFEGWSIPIYFVCILWVYKSYGCVCCLLFCRMHPSTHRNDDDTRHNLFGSPIMTDWTVIDSTRGSRRSSTSQRENARTAPFSRPLGECHGVTYYYFTYHCFIEYVCDYVMSTYINGHCPYCLLKRDGATRWTRCDNLWTDDVGRGLQRMRG